MCLGNLCGMPVCPVCGQGIINFIHAVYLSIGGIISLGIATIYYAFKKQLWVLLSFIPLIHNKLIKYEK
ncbi:MAG: hypothetical protein QW727_04030 [Candidatus Pacearchaeota archaeon]